MRILGIDIGGTFTKLGLFNEHVELLESWIYPTKNETGGKTILDDLTNRIEKLRKLDAIGICIPGQIDAESGEIIGELVNIPDTANLPIKKTLEERFSVPVYIRNDVHAAALGESHLGIGKKESTFLYIAYGTGIGGAMIKNRKLETGANGYAGEFGHIITHAKGRRCNCGGSGCYERYGSTQVLVEEAMKIDSTYHNGEKVIAAYQENNKAIQSVFHHWLDEVTAGLVSLVHIFNPKTLVLGGGIMENGIIVTELQNRVNEQILPAFRQVAVEKATLGNRAGMYGAAYIAIKGA